MFDGGLRVKTPFCILIRIWRTKGEDIFLSKNTKHEFGKFNIAFLNLVFGYKMCLVKLLLSVIKGVLKSEISYLWQKYENGSIGEDTHSGRRNRKWDD